MLTQSLGEQLGLYMEDSHVKECTAKIKAIADFRKLAVNDIDQIIRSFYENLSTAQEKALVRDMTTEERKILARKEMEFQMEAREVRVQRQNL